MPVKNTARIYSHPYTTQGVKSKIQLAVRFSVITKVFCCAAVYMQSLSQILQIMGAPLVQLMEEEIHKNKDKLEKLKREHEQLVAVISATESDSVAS